MFNRRTSNTVQTFDSTITGERNGISNTIPKPQTKIPPLAIMTPSLPPTLIETTNTNTNNLISFNRTFNPRSSLSSIASHTNTNSLSSSKTTTSQSNSNSTISRNINDENGSQLAQTEWKSPSEVNMRDYVSAANIGVSMNKFTLLFSNPFIELEYVESNFGTKESLLSVRACFAINFLLWITYSIWDEIYSSTSSSSLSSATKLDLFLLRYVFVGLISLSILGFTFSPAFAADKLLSEKILVFYMLVHSFGIIGAMMLAPLELGASYYYGLMVSFVVFYNLSSVRFKLTLQVCVFITCLYELALITTSPGLAEALQINVFLIFAHGFALLGSYNTEKNRRMNFIAAVFVSKEQEKSENLLRNVLPDHVIAHLRNTQTTAAFSESYQDVTILFTDIVGFTTMSSKMNPAEVVDMLNEIFIAFDVLVDHYKLSKIKTIGDAYMLAGGVKPHNDNLEHTETVVLAGLEMIQAVETISRRRGGDPLQIRVGIHTGPIAAGVVGWTKYIFDLWGDTVNVASRMESTGIAGRVQVSRQVYEKIVGKDIFELESRPSVVVKGKGELETWFINGTKLPDPMAESIIKDEEEIIEQDQVQATNDENNEEEEAEGEIISVEPDPIHTTHNNISVASS